MAAEQGFSTSPNMLAQMAAQLGGTAAVPAVQRSQYLADALQNISHAGEGIKSWGALGSNLLADVLLQYGRGKSNADLLKSIQGAQGNMLKASVSGTGLDGSATPSAPAEPAAPLAPAAAAFAAPDAPAMVSPPPPAAPTSAKNQALAALIKGGVSPMGAAGLVGGFGQESGPDLARNNPAEGAIGMANWEGPRGAAAQQYFAQHGGPSIDNQAAFALSELHGPEARAMTALQAAQDPQAAAAAALQFERPAGWTPHGLPQNASGWDARLAGAQELAPVAAGMAMPPAPDQTLAQGGPPAPMPPAAMPPQGQPAPVQLAMLGGPQAMAGMAAPPPAPQGAPAAPVAPPQAPQPQQGIPTGPDATPQEIALYRQYSQFPVGSLGWSKAMEIAQTVQARHAEPIKLNPGEYFDQNGQARSVHAMQDMQSPSPNATVQRDPVTGELKVTANPAYGPLTTNTHMLPGGAVAANPIGAMATAGGMGGPSPGAQGGGLEWSEPQTVPGLAGLQVRNNLTGDYKPAGPSAATITPAGGGGAVWSQKPGEAPQLVEGPIHAEAVNQRGVQFSGRDEVKQAKGALEALNSYGQALSTIHPSGIVGQQGIDAYIRAISAPTQGVRQGPVNVLIEHMNWPDAVKGHVLQAIGQGFLPPAVLKEMGQAIFLAARERVRSAQKLADTDNQWAARYGFKPSDLGEDVPQMPTVPAYIVDRPPPAAQRQVGMTLWGTHGPVKWNGQSWDPVQ